jgi:hypothetical protein
VGVQYSLKERGKEEITFAQNNTIKTKTKINKKLQLYVI